MIKFEFGYHQPTQTKPIYAGLKVEIMAICIRIIVLIMVIVSTPTTVFALKNDKNQPAVIDADSTEFDFRTGTRTWIGNVRVRQGTMRITADKLVANYKNNVLQNAMAYGNPAVFTQRPQDQPDDVIGKGLRLELDEVNNLVTFFEKASVKQGANTVNGKKIVYNMATEKMKVTGDKARGTKTRVDGDKISVDQGGQKKPKQQKKTNKKANKMTKSVQTVTPKIETAPSKSPESSIKNPTPVSLDKPKQDNTEESPKIYQRPHIRIMPKSKPVSAN